MNHSFVTVKGSLSKNKLNSIILKINETFFKNVFTIINDGNYWEIKYEWPFQLGITIDNKRKLHLRPSGGNFSGWLEDVFQNEIAAELNGTCSCEAFEDKWKPIKNKYNNYRDYWNILNNNFEFKNPEHWKFACDMFEKYIKSWPNELKQFAGPFPDPNILPNYIVE